MTEGPYRRNAFISYSHQQDVPLAAALQRGLHRLARPWTRRQTVSVFRDTTSLGAASDLGGAILQELRGSEYFVLIASPAAARSRWVREEVGFWIANRPMEHFLIAVSDGTISWDPDAGDWDWDRTDCLPEVLRGAFPREPLWVDLAAVRAAGRYSLRDAPFRDAVATLLAPLRGQTKDEVDSEDLRQRRTAVRMLRAAVTALSALLALSLIAGVVAWQQRGQALDRARTSASQALAARALEAAQSDPRKAAQFALYAYAVQPTGESTQALGRAVAANDNVAEHFQPGSEAQADWHGVGKLAPTRVAVSRDGNMLAYYTDFDRDLPALDSPRHVHLYDIGARASLPPIEGVEWPLGGGVLEMSRDGRFLVLERSYNEFDLWDVSQRKVMRSFTASEGRRLSEAHKGLKAFALSPDGQRVAAAYYVPPAEDDANGDITFRLAVWDAATGRRLTDESAAPERVSLTFDGDGRLHAFDQEAGTVRSLARDSVSWSTPRKVANLPDVRDRRAGLSADGTKAYLGPGTQDAGDQIWDLDNGRRLAAGDDQGLVRALPEGNGPVTVVTGKSVAAYDSALGDRRVLGTFGFDVQSVSASADGRWVAAGSLDGAVSLFSTSSVQGGTTVPNDPHVSAAELTRDARVAARGVAGGMDLWSVTGTGVRRLGHIAHQPQSPGVAGSVGVVVSADGSRAVLGEESRLSLWNLRDGTQTGTGKDYGASVVPLCFLPDGVHVAAVVRGSLQVLDTRSWQTTQTVAGKHEPVVVSADGTTVAGVSPDGVSVWRLTGENRLALVRKAAVVGTVSMSIVISGKGEKVATVNGDGRITLVDVATGHTATSTGTTHSGAGRPVFGEDASVLVEATGTGKQAVLQFWDSVTGEARGSWSWADQGSGSLTPSPAASAARLFTGADGTVLAFAPDGTLVRRPLSTATWRKILCDLVPDPLPRSDYDRYLKGLDVPAPCRPE
ncbi:WD40 repeat protein [Streptomyces sp. 2132.2]|uniref:toll/interleukin-1 receptor domain-containing protein n=1 Tax=Streptomyces sp. 2132.2 TaxID=2485161 RepID=UPI000F48260E|nr:TIR domain-containing protein [Streptomyces sp. 2132.2]ROQ95298.1 WD40 repeat protein [Streptomyces sp. 2132.2]